MRDLTETERASIIELARELDAESMTEDISGPGKFDGASDRQLAHAMEIISGHGAADETAGDVETCEGHASRVGRVILWTDTQGFMSTAIYADEAEAIHACEVASVAASDDDEPAEDDATLSPTGPLGAQMSVSYAGKHLGVFDSDENAEIALAAEMVSQSFWPDVWTISDHGNALCISERFYAEHADIQTFRYTCEISDPRETYSGLWRIVAHHPPSGMKDDGTARSIEAATAQALRSLYLKVKTYADADA